MQNLKDKVAVVFGHREKLGEQLSDRLPNTGAKVYVIARNLEAVNIFGSGD